MSSGIKAVIYLLTHNAPLIVSVPVARITPAVIPENSALPAIAISHVSTRRRKLVAESANEYCSSRIQVTVMAASYSSLQTVIELVRAALPRTRGTVDGVAVDNILHELDGPDFRDDEIGAYLATLDYLVTFNE